jgi:hypothetical protein
MSDASALKNLGSALRFALSDVARNFTCTYRIPAPPVGQALDPNKVNVLVSLAGAAPKTLARGDDRTPCKEGWRYVQDGRAIELCGTDCAAVTADNTARLELLFGCETKLQQPK